MLTLVSVTFQSLWASVWNISTTKRGIIKKYMIFVGNLKNYVGQKSVSNFTTSVSHHSKDLCGGLNSSASGQGCGGCGGPMSLVCFSRASRLPPMRNLKLAHPLRPPRWFSEASRRSCGPHVAHRLHNSLVKARSIMIGWQGKWRTTTLQQWLSLRSLLLAKSLW